MEEETKLSKEELVYLASYAVGKGLDYETMEWSDEMYGKQEYMDAVWEYVIECRENGRNEFRDKYSEYKLFPGI